MSIKRSAVGQTGEHSGESEKCGHQGEPSSHQGEQRAPPPSDKGEAREEQARHCGDGHALSLLCFVDGLVGSFDVETHGQGNEAQNQRDDNEDSRGRADHDIAPVPS